MFIRFYFLQSREHDTRENTVTPNCIPAFTVLIETNHSPMKFLRCWNFHTELFFQLIPILELHNGIIEVSIH